MKVNLNQTNAALFRSGTHKVNNPLYNTNTLTCVSFNQLLDYTKTCAEFISKAKRAENHLFSNFNKWIIQTFIREQPRTLI
jgi:hypothetical protein